MTEPAVTARITLARAGFTLDVAMEIPARGITGILGASGSGKTTLLRCLAGLEPDCRGEVRVQGEVWQDARAFLPPHRRSAGVVFQDARLFPHLSARDNLLYGQRRSTPGPLRIDHVVDLLGLGSLLDRRPARLSGGEAQRVAIGRALLRNPAVVLMDEPLANLDAARKQEILPFLERLHAELTIPILYVSHSLDEVSRLCDHLLVLADGRVEASGELHDVLSRPDLSLPLDEEAGAVLDAEIVEHAAGHDLTRMRTGAGDLLVPGRHGEPGRRIRLRILARDVSLTLAPAQATTILNILPVTIESRYERGGGYVDLRLRAGTEHLLARVSRRSCDLLQLQPGGTAHAQLKAVAIREPSPQG